MIQAGRVTPAPPFVTVTRSPFTNPSRSAMAGETSSGLSQVSFVNGRGSSCSQALLA
jgi:hypothetical protein